MNPFFSRRSFPLAAAAFVATRALVVSAQPYIDITGANSTIATDGSGNVISSGVTYDTITKPVPPNLVSEGGNEYLPWIGTNGGYTSNKSIDYQINPSPESGGTYLSSTDKIDTTLETTDDTTYSLGFDSPKYLGFAVNIPAAGFIAPVTTPPANTGVQIAQWWQGSPYSPPLALDMVGESNGMVSFDLQVHNDSTGGNPSSVPLIAGSGTIPFDSWNTFVVMTDMDYNGSGQIEVWENGTLISNWTGAVGYNPTTIPYNPSTGQPYPKTGMNVYFGPYRPSQETEQSEYFDDVRWASDYTDAVPVPQAQVVVTSTSGLTVPTDGDIGGSLSSGLTFSGGELAVTSSFTSGRAITIGSAGGTLDVASGVTFGFGNSLNWSGGTLNIVDSGTAAISQSSGSVSVTPGSKLSISANSKVTVGGSVDPFTDSSNANNHVAIVNNGSLTIDANTAVAGITGAGSLTIGNGSTKNTLHLAAGSGLSTLSSLTINSPSVFDIENNDVILSYTTSDPKAKIIGYLKNGTIDSSTAASNPGYGVGMVDGADGVLGASVTSGQIELAYTLYGDANLDDKVDITDFNIFAPNFGLSTTLGWEAGDFNYSGAVDIGDFNLFAANFGLSDSGEDISIPAADETALESFAAANGLSLTSVPEPAAAGMLVLGTVGFLARRRRTV